MSDVLFDRAPPPPADAALPSPTPTYAAAAARWLGGLLDAARDRGDAALCRLIAGVMDDLRAGGG